MKATSSHRSFYFVTIDSVLNRAKHIFFNVCTIKTAAEFPLERDSECLAPLLAVLLAGTKHVWDLKGYNGYTDYTETPKASEILGAGESGKCRCLNHVIMMSACCKNPGKRRSEMLTASLHAACFRAMDGYLTKLTFHCSLSHMETLFVFGFFC